MFSLTVFWWLIILCLGLVSLPLSSLLFKDFYDRGYIFSKIISLMLVSYLVWLFAILKILPFGLSSILLFILLIIGFNFFLIKRNKRLSGELKNCWRAFLFEEGLFSAGFFFWSYVRSFQPNIHGLEKFMDFGFVNAILRSRWFPPNDMWLAGNSINYYYFGHLQTAVLTKLSRLNPAITYNLMLATICGLTFSAGFSITSNLIHWVFNKQKNRHFLLLIGGLTSALILTFGGNLQILYHWLKEKSLATYWYPDATRFIIEKFGAADNTIHEFPVYSWVVADLHGHLLDIPHVLLMIGLILCLFHSFCLSSQKPTLSEKIKGWLNKVKAKFFFLLPPEMAKTLTQTSIFQESQSALKESLQNLPILLALGLTLAVAFMTNAWDYPIYLLYAGAVLLLSNYLKHNKKGVVFIQTFFYCLWLLAISFVFFLPFYLNFENIAQGIALVDFHSPLWMLIFLWGFPLFTSICFIVFTKKLGKRAEKTDYLVLALIAISWLLILIPEILRIKDIYVHTHQRANTVFKLTYQAFVVFRLLSGYILIRLLTGLKQKFLKRSFLIVFLAGLVVILTYPRFAIKSYYNNLKNSQGLNGLKYLSLTYPDDYEGILWLNENIKEAPVIVEAVGESYTDFARVSANTGLPTILGWRVHEWLWRGSFDIAGKRTEEVKKIYTSQNKEEVKNLLNEYQVKFIFVGALEKEAYPELNEKIFTSLGKIIFSSGETRIYQIN